MSIRCLVDGCSRSRSAPRGLCRRHYDNLDIRFRYNTVDGPNVRATMSRRPNQESLCWASDCDSTVDMMRVGRGLCARCYLTVRHRMSNNSGYNEFPVLSIEEKHWSLCRPGEGCWGWAGSFDIEGYPRFSYNKRNSIKAHRFSLSMKVGRELLPHELACHRCDNPGCVNPEHLFVGTPKDNMRDMILKGRASWQKERKVVR